jgi:8-oxo-dGTP pyrophosphatase MutT (NUDIX family)
MEPDRRQTIVALSGRSFATFPAAVVVPIVNRPGELLLLESLRRQGLWEPVNGAVDEGESLLEAALREVREEAGPNLRVISPRRNPVHLERTCPAFGETPDGPRMGDAPALLAARNLLQRPARCMP